MKYILIAISLFFLNTAILGQEDSVMQVTGDDNPVLIIKNDGTKINGIIVSQDAREILLRGVEKFGEMYVPLHEIREIKEINVNQASGYELFSTRYFLTTNGLSMEKGSKYAMLNYYGPEAHFTVANDLTLGVMTTWGAIPLVASIKGSFHLGEKVHFSLGSLLGTLSWIKPDAAGALAYGALTYGDSDNNINISAGYLGITYDGSSFSSPLLSVACLFRVGENIQFVGDSFIYLGENSQDNFALIVPGLRFERPSHRSSIQVGIGGAILGGDAIPVPIPLFSWFYDL